MLIILIMSPSLNLIEANKDLHLIDFKPNRIMKYPKNLQKILLYQEFSKYHKNNIKETNGNFEVTTNC